MVILRIDTSISQQTNRSAKNESNLYLDYENIME